MGKTHRKSRVYAGQSRLRAIQEAVHHHARYSRYDWGNRGVCSPEDLATAAREEARHYDRAHWDGNGNVFDIQMYRVSPFKASRRKMRTRLAILTQEGWDDGFDNRQPPQMRDEWW